MENKEPLNWDSLAAQTAELVLGEPTLSWRDLGAKLGVAFQTLHAGMHRMFPAIAKMVSSSAPRGHKAYSVDAIAETAARNLTRRGKPSQAYARALQARGADPDLIFPGAPLPEPQQCFICGGMIPAETLSVAHGRRVYPPMHKERCEDRAMQWVSRGRTDAQRMLEAYNVGVRFSDCGQAAKDGWYSGHPQSGTASRAKRAKTRPPVNGAIES